MVELVKPAEQRPVVSMKVNFLNTEYEQEVSLDKRNFIPFLVNRDFMKRANLMINPARKFLLTNKKMIQPKSKPSIQERCRERELLDAWGDVEEAIDNWQKKFDMYKWLNQLGYSPMVVKYMSGLNENTIYEIKNEEGCEQLAEGYNWLKTPKQKQNYLDFHIKIESDIQEWLKNNKIVRKKRIQTPAQKVKKLNYLQSGEGLTSIDPVEIIRAKKLFTYNVKSRKLRCYSSYGLNVKGTSITSCDKVEEKTLTDIKLLDRLIKGGNIIANGFMDELRTKSKTQKIILSIKIVY